MTDKPAKLTVVVRADLAAGYQAAQALHAARQFAAVHPAIEAEWFASSNTVVLLNAKDEPTLERVVNRCVEEGVRYAVFREPDLGGSITAVAIEPDGHRITKRYPLMLKGSASLDEAPVDMKRFVERIKELLFEPCQNCDGSGQVTLRCRCGGGCWGTEGCQECNASGKTSVHDSDELTEILDRLQAGWLSFVPLE